MSIPFWDDAPEAWQAVAIDGEVLPGVARIDSVSRPRKIHAAQPGGAPQTMPQERSWDSMSLSEQEASLDQLARAV